MKMIYGASGTGKTTETVRLAAENISRGKDTVIIVPEQFSFEFERLMYESAGAAAYNSGHLSVCSFSKLSERIFDVCGTQNGKYADEAVKSVILYRALRNLVDRKSLRVLSKRVKYPGFRAKILKALRELSDNRIKPENLRNRFEGGGAGLPDKISDITDIYAEYVKTLKDSGYRDEINRHLDAARIAFINGFFKGKTVFIDSFSGFTADETEIIKTAAKTAEDVFLTLPTNLEDEIFGVFESVNLTQNRIFEAMRGIDVPVFTYKMLRENKRFKNLGLLSYSENLFSSAKKPSDKKGALTLFSGKDAEEEAKFCAAAIYRLCAVKKIYSFGEIAIAVKNISDYAGIFESVFRRFNIPLWIDEKEDIKGKRTAVFLLSFLTAACLKTADSDDFIRIAKCGFLTHPDGAPVDEKDIDNLENFCFSNGIKRSDWGEPFTDPEAEKMRLLIVSLLREFTEKTAKADGKVFIKTLAEITERIDIKSKIKGAPPSDSDELFAERGDVRTWNLLCDVFADLYEVFPEGETVAPEEFCRVFEAAAADLKLSSPPQALDTVMMISASAERLSSPKVLFIAGANQDVFPGVPVSDGFFSESDIETLRERNIIITGTLTERLADERFAAYAVASSASERLFITYRTSGESGSLMYPSELVKNAEAVFPGMKIHTAQNLGAAFFCLTPEATYAEYISRFGEHYPDMAVMKAALLKIPEYAERIMQNDNAGFSLEPPVSKLIYGDVIRFSATGFETFAACPFKFFAKYGLRVFPRKKNDLTANVRGGVIHDCLKNVGEGIAESRYAGDFDALLRADIKRFMDSYLESSVENGKKYKSEHFKSEYENIFGAAYDVSKHLIAEFSGSGFVPSEFEYGIGIGDSPTPPLSVITKKGRTARFSGIADRVDKWENIIRVVDYKSFDKAFSFAEMYDGINLQPVFYIAALCENGKYKGTRPGGIIYLFSYEIEPNIPRRSDSDGKKIKTSGAVLNEPEVIDAMEKPEDSKSYKFIPVKYIKKSGEMKNTLTSEEFSKLSEFSKEKLAAAADEIADGVCEASPLAEKAGESKACKWCDYYSLCGNYPPLSDSRSYSLNEESAKEKITGENA